jgi:hypothetical protein
LSFVFLESTQHISHPFSTNNLGFSQRCVYNGTTILATYFPLPLDEVGFSETIFFFIAFGLSVKLTPKKFATVTLHCDTMCDRFDGLSKDGRRHGMDTYLFFDLI